MVIELDTDVFDAIVKDGAYCEPTGDRVIARRGNGEETIGLLIPVSAVKDAVGFVVTDNEGGTDGDDSVELGCVRCDTLSEAINAMVHGVEGKKEVTFYCELCVDYDDHIDGIARWCHTNSYADGSRWE